ncbi:MAG TPA: 16S rRNA (guanine(527)-N(7))-methyltransferase RsmG [Burkholderiaceae bacterium]|nr:16S rRNA (guanine(527)-N(7))-methyltransferase RsmG [Burkholderiaceae bacterium]
MQASLDSDFEVSAHCIGVAARELGLELTPAQSGQLERFVRLLLRWNRIHNLTAVTKEDEVLSHHLLDSLSLVRELPAAPPLRILDAGAGAGLPGIPLAVALPGHQFTLIDAVAKKCAFTTQVSLELVLTNVHTLHGRLEQLQGQFDVIVSRALGSLAAFVSLTRHLLAPGGHWIAMKGRLPAEELLQLPPDVTAARTAELRVPLLQEARHLIVLRPAPPSR